MDRIWEMSEYHITNWNRCFVIQSLFFCDTLQTKLTQHQHHPSPNVQLQQSSCKINVLLEQTHEVVFRYADSARPYSPFSIKHVSSPQVLHIAPNADMDPGHLLHRHVERQDLQHAGRDGRHLHRQGPQAVPRHPQLPAHPRHWPQVGGVFGPSRLIVIMMSRLKAYSLFPLSWSVVSSSIQYISYVYG